MRALPRATAIMRRSAPRRRVPLFLGRRAVSSAVGRRTAGPPWRGGLEAELRAAAAFHSGEADRLAALEPIDQRADLLAARRRVRGDSAQAAKDDAADQLGGQAGGLKDQSLAALL